MDLPISKYGKTERRKFGNINEVIDIPDLVEIQKDSYKAFTTAWNGWDDLRFEISFTAIAYEDGSVDWFE